MNRRHFAASTAGAVAALGFRPSLAVPAGRPGSSPESWLYFTSDFEQWDGWTAPGLDLSGRSRLIRVLPALTPGEVSTVQVGRESGSKGGSYGPALPLTPAVWATLVAGLDRNRRKAGGPSLYTISAAEAETWLDPFPA